VTAIEEVVELYRRGLRIALLEGPTGSGKTIVAEAVRRALGLPGLYLCARKALQDQAAGDLPYAVVLKGRANYPTLNYPEWFALPPKHPDRLTCEDCTNRRRRGCAWRTWKRGSQPPSECRITGCDPQELALCCLWCTPQHDCPDTCRRPPPWRRRWRV
jgi:Rad3-related DNA helicase